MPKRDYYEVLGLQKNAGDSEIKRAYRKLAKKYHPDSNPNNKQAEQLFKEITESYNILSDPEKKKLYDKYGHAAFDGSMGDDPEAYARQQAEFFHNTDVKGRRKNGNWSSGEWNFGDGMHSGFSYHSSNTSNASENPFEIFGDLFGHGKSRSGTHRAWDFGEPEASDLTCDISIPFRDAVLGCEKQITFRDPQIGTLSVKIPAGIRENTTIRLNRDQKSRSGEHRGNILLKVHIEDDPEYIRKDNDLYVHAKIPYTLASLGGETTFQTLYGPVTCRIPAGSSTGRKIRLKGKGVISAKDHSYGDQYVILDITVPKKLSEREKRLMQELAEIEKCKI